MSRISMGKYRLQIWRAHGDYHRQWHPICQSAGSQLLWQAPDQSQICVCLAPSYQRAGRSC
ncbi:hypothetical protein AXF42_Ash012403 [Apostasia shenzhenica]|uniref:Uncharacterized protein n=1 Tax=Apostasia shenzhenica TaxID=1088818 RepID=A0A2I0AQP5_9ASPA|nr:hypothetical protein AXF42_Ash012403 [Apostasia shenzhenica]